jgi:DNA-binding NarL/FixJ family response regulator
MCTFCGCEKVYAKGYCSKCYARYRKHGTAEYMRKTIRVGDRFFRLEVIEKLKNSQCRCKCDCGKTTAVFSSCLKAGQTRSCGCYQKELVRKYHNFKPVTARQKEVYTLYQKGMSYQEIGKKLNVTRQAIGSIMKSCAVEA